MGFDALLTKVKQAEETLEAREREAVGRWRHLAASWRAAWTPGRIVIVGLAAGFVAGRAKPAQLASSGNGVVALLRTLAPLLAGLQAGVQTAQAAQEEVQEGPPAPAPAPAPAPVVPPSYGAIP
ncbi:hypothetical protein [Thermomonas fusca]|uniref:Protein sip-5 n=1 Tax=Thermomonas fusca TaxID=215690 RepID=A0A5R9PH94_9GAMM|nr:hypothetical protein [Thermomonas fusca]TLX22865.1 hypothetical protein E5S66_02230 [Thermomonas fusca]